MLVWVHSLTFKIKHLDILKLWFKNGSIFKTVILNILLMKSEYSYAKAHEEKQVYVLQIGLFENMAIWTSNEKISFVFSNKRNK